ncbi:MAG TPA: hypothetical protein PKA26_11195 [bacterium]|nr:hypothetical protein [bacterium]
MNKSNAKEQLDYIQTVLDRATIYTNISGWSAISVGLLGTIAGFYSEWALKGSLDYQTYIASLVGCWSFCFIASIALAVFFSARRAKRMNEKIWGEPIKQAVRHFSVFVFIGGVQTAACTFYHAYYLIPSVWMLCYGGGIIVGGLYSVKEIRILGLFFLAAGSIALFSPVWNQIALMSTFGFGHIILGLIILKKYNQPLSHKS